MKITIIGAGALGSHLLMFLRNVDAAITIVDFDSVEQKNVSSQFHTRMTLRQNKVVALERAMQGLFGVRVRAFPVRLTDQNVEMVLKDPDLVIDCTDNHAARVLIQSHAKQHNIPCLHGGLAAGQMFARIMWTEKFAADQEDSQGQQTCEDGAFLPFIARVSALMAQSVQRFLEDGTKESYQVLPAKLMTL